MNKRRQRIPVAVEVITSPKQGEIETQLDALCQRYGLTREWIYNIRKFLGHPTWIRNKHWYSKKERQEIDYYYVAISADWGLRMSRNDYGREILDHPPIEEGNLTRPYTLNDFLLSHEGCDLITYVKKQGAEWFIENSDLYRETSNGN